MIGQGIFENTYLFADVTIHDKIPEEKMRLLLDHLHLWQETWGASKHFPALRKFFKVYANGFPGAQDLRMQLMETETPEATEQLVRAFYRRFLLDTLGLLCALLTAILTCGDVLQYHGRRLNTLQ